MNISVEKRITESYELNVGDSVTFGGDVSRGEWYDITAEVVYISPNEKYFVYLKSGYPKTESVDNISKINGIVIRP